jgi:hypothetical protein
MLGCFFSLGDCALMVPTRSRRQAGHTRDDAGMADGQLSAMTQAEPAATVPTHESHG